MYPVLLTIGPVSVDSYYVIWGAALVMAVSWMRRRCASRYGISFDDASDVLVWVIAGVAIGATLGGYLDHWRRYADDPASMLIFWRAGLSSGPGFLGGGLAGLWKLKRLGLSVDDFAEAASVPCAFMLAIGRVGCFLSGCCVGTPTDSPIGLAFPSAPFTRVWPTQLFESAAALVIGLILAAVERAIAGRQRHGAVLWPLFLLLYGGYRLVIDFLRAGDRILGLRVGQYAGMLAVVMGIGWLIFTYKRTREGRTTNG